MKKAELFHHIIDYFQAHQPNAATELHYGNPFELLVAVILSAQCTDKRVNMVTPELFHRFPTAKKMAEADIDEVREYIKSISYPNSKAGYLVNGSKVLMEKFKGEVPSTIEELTTIPGVGRKTANVIASVVYNKPAMAVDTHVFRVAARIGLIELQVLVLWAVQNGFFDKIPVEKTKDFQLKLTEFLNTRQEKLLETVRNKGAIDDALTAEIKTVVSGFADNYQA